MITQRSISVIGRLVTALGLASIGIGVTELSGVGLPSASAQSSGFVAPVTLTPSSGDSSTTFEMTLPEGAPCGGTGVDGYRFHTFLIPSGTAVESVSFDAFGPSVGETPFTDGFNQQRNRNPETSPVGLISQYEATHTMTAYDPAFRPVAGSYQIGVACTLSQSVTEYWAETVTLTDDASDTGNAGFVWTSGAVASVPTAPTNVVVVAADGAVEVSFDAVAATPAVSEYEVTANDNEGGVFTATGGGSPLSIDGLTNGTEYDITVTATNTEGTSAPSSPAVQATPTAAPEAPGAPTNVSAAPANGELVVAFTPATTGPEADSFAVTVAAGSDESTATGTSSPITVGGLVNGTSYTVTVTATANGVVGEPSTAITATPVAPARVPDAPVLDTAVGGDGVITVEFTPASTGDAATSYTAVASALVDGRAELSAAIGNGSPLTIERLMNGVEYEVIVFATNAIGDSAESNRLAATPAPLPPKPGAPTIDSVVAGDGQATVTFTPAEGAEATEFVVTATDAAATEQSLSDTRTATGAASPIVVTGLDNGVTYDITVAATNAAGTSEASVAVQVTPADSGGTTAGETTNGTTTGGTTTGGSTAGGTTTGGTTTGGTTSGTTGSTGTTGSGTPRVLVATGSSNGWLAVWAGVLLIVGRMVILSGRSPRIIDPSER